MQKDQYRFLAFLLYYFAHQNLHQEFFVQENEHDDCVPAVETALSDSVEEADDGELWEKRKSFFLTPPAEGRVF